MLGINLMTGSHFDEYIVDFSIFRPYTAAMPAALFKPPAICTQAGARAGAGAEAGGRLTAQLMTLLPSANIGERVLLC